MSTRLRSAARSAPASKLAAFTLVELLVVMGIIALLISILLPTLSKAQKQARSVVCESNLRVLGQAITAYVVDSKGCGWFGSFTSVTPPRGSSLEQNVWFTLQETTGGAFTFDNYHGYLTPYYRDPRIMQCPELTDEHNTNVGYAGEPITGYVYNYTVDSDFKGVPPFCTKFANITKPADTVALYDGLGVSGGLVTLSYYGYQPSISNVIKIPSFHGLHSGKTGNVLWYDSHVTTEKPFIGQVAQDYLSSYVAFIPNYQALNLGYLINYVPTEPMTSDPNAINLNYYYWADKGQQK